MQAQTRRRRRQQKQQQTRRRRHLVLVAALLTAIKVSLDLVLYDSLHGIAEKTLKDAAVLSGGGPPTMMNSLLSSMGTSLRMRMDTGSSSLRRHHEDCSNPSKNLSSENIMIFTRVPVGSPPFLSPNHPRIRMRTGSTVLLLHPPSTRTRLWSLGVLLLLPIVVMLICNKKNNHNNNAGAFCTTFWWQRGCCAKPDPPRMWSCLCR